MSDTPKTKAKKSLFGKILMGLLVFAAVAVGGLGIAVFQTLTKPVPENTGQVSDSGIEMLSPKGASAAVGVHSGEPMEWVPAESAASVPQVAVVPKAKSKSKNQAASDVAGTELLPVNVAEEKVLQPVNVPKMPVKNIEPAAKKSPAAAEQHTPPAKSSNKPLDALL